MTLKAGKVCLTHGLCFGIDPTYVPESLSYGGDLTAFTTHVSLAGTHYVQDLTAYT